jgi:hypothetical protein
MAVSKLQRRAVEIAEQFVQTIVLIDDEAYTLFKPSPSGQLEKADLTISEPALHPGDGSEAADTSESTPTTTTVVDSEEKSFTEGFGDATPTDLSQGLNSRNIVANFAQRGLVCGIIEPNPNGSDLDQLLKVAKRSDVLIVDWVFSRDQGKTAKHIIKEVLGTDSPERLRLIVVYTGDEGVGKIVSEIATVTDKLTATDKNVLSDDRTRIAVLQKAQVGSRNKNAVTVDDLPDRVLTEFAALYSGLVTLVAMKGLSELRSNTHHLLGRLRKHLDPAYLTHRMLLPHPEDAQEFLTDLVGQEIAAMLHSYEIGSVADLSAAKDWLEDSGKIPKQGADFAKDIGYEGDPREELVELGVAGFLSRRVSNKSKHREFEKSIHKLGSKIFIEDKKKADDADQEFAHVSSMVSLYESKLLPRLTLGTVLMLGTDDYLVCIQPLCDCVRIKEPRRFPFLLGRKNNNSPNLILRGSMSIRLKVEIKPTSLVQHTFQPRSGKDVIYASREGEELTFESSDKKRFIWQGQFKFAQAQRIAQQFGSSLARVGLDESEWLRRFDRGAQANDGNAVTPPAASVEPQDRIEEKQ